VFVGIVPSADENSLLAGVQVDGDTLSKVWEYDLGAKYDIISLVYYNNYLYAYLIPYTAGVNDQALIAEVGSTGLSNVKMIDLGSNAGYPKFITVSSDGGLIVTRYTGMDTVLTKYSKQGDLVWNVELVSGDFPATVAIDGNDYVFVLHSHEFA